MGLNEVRTASLIRFIYAHLRKKIELYYRTEDEYLRQRKGWKNRRVWHSWIRLDELFEYSLAYNVKMEDVEGFIDSNRVLTKYYYGMSLVGWRCTVRQYLSLFYYIYGRTIRSREKEYREFSAERGVDRMVLKVCGFIPEIKCRVGLVRYMKERMGYEQDGDNLRICLTDVTKPI